MSRKTILFILIILFSKTLSSQTSTISFDKLTVESGLSQSSVFSIAQDHTGFMWFGTKDGLNRFDSKHFEIFRNNSKDTTSISSSQNINALLSDSKNDLWIGTQLGLNKYLPETKSFRRYLYKSNDKFSLSNNTIRCIYEDKEGNLWIGTENGLNKLNKNGKFSRFFCKGFPGEGLVNPIIKAIYQDYEGTLWIGTQLGLVAMTNKQNVLSFKTYFHDETNNNSLSDNDINTIAGDKENNLWIGTHFKGVNKLEKGASLFQHFNSSNSGLVNNTVRKILVDKDGKLWIATIYGVSIYDPTNKTFQNQIYTSENTAGLNQNSIYDIYQDRVGSVWVGTYYGGVNVYHPNAIPFQVYKHYSFKNSLSSNIISAVKEDQYGNLWIGTEAEGLNYFDRRKGLFKNFKAQGGENSLSSNLIKAISVDKKNNLWIAAYEGGVDYYNTSSGKFKKYNLIANPSIDDKRITYLICDHKGRLWVGTTGKGLFLFNKDKESFYSLKNPNSKYHLPELNINSLYQDNKNTIWIATDKGLYFLKENSSQFVKLFLKNSTFFSQISCIAQASGGQIIFGNYSEGLGFYNPLSKKMKVFSIKDGLQSNSIYGIVEDNEARVWVSTDKGLASIKENFIKVYNRNDGLSGNVFNYNSVLKDRNGALFFGGYSGLISFYPTDISENKTPPSVVFTNLRLFNKEVPIKDGSVLSKSLTQTEVLVFNYQQNVFSIDFSVLNFVKSKKNKFAYKLIGFENHWNEIEEPTATFTNLPPGTYNLFVKGSNNDGVFNNEVTSLKIIIKPPFWLTWWAYLFYFFAFLALLYLIMRFLLIRALLKREHDVNQMKLNFFTNVSHEIRTPLTLILGPMERMIQETQDDLNVNKQLLIVNKNAKRLMRLVNELMDFRKIESGNMKLNLSPHNIVSFVNEIYSSFTELAQQKQITYTFSANPENIEVYFDKEQLEKVIFNLLSNAFKFTAKTNSTIEVEVSQQKQNVFIRIMDNGEGIPNENVKNLFTDFYQVPNHQQRNLGSGIGLALSKNIAKLHHGDLVLEQGGVNTTFCLSLIMGNSQYKSEEIVRTQTIEPRNIFQFNANNIEVLTEEPIKKNVIIGSMPLILVVDDNIEIKEFIVNTLMPLYQVISASNGIEALDLAFEKIPDVIISDVMMPEMDGFELCAKLKTDIRTRHIPIVLLTARSSDLHELEGLKTGADIYLTKPFSTTKLQLIVENLVILHQNMREKFSQQFSLEPTDLQIESSDKEFLSKALKLLDHHMSNSEFNVNFFASEIGMSTPVFYKKINALTGLTVNNFIKSIRLKRALQLLQQKVGNISEVAYMVGFNDAKYFSKEFKKQYGKSPSSYD